MPKTPQSISLRIEGIETPTRACPGPDGVFIGIQRGTDVIDRVPSSTESPRFHLAVDVLGDDETQDFRGPYVHGRPGDRFLYLAWVHRLSGETLARIKLRLGDIDPSLIVGAMAGDTLVGRLRLVNDLGKPVSGSVRPPDVTWSADEQQ